MPGLSLVSGDTFNEKMLNDAVKDLQSDTISKSEVLFRDNRIVIVFSGYDGYPKTYRETEEFVLCFEGMIYNITSDKLGEKLLTIAESIVHEDGEDSIAHFVLDTDGDYFCIVYSKNNGRIVFFNDRLGRLPAFYSANDRLFVISRELKFLLHFLPSILLDRLSITQFLMFEYNLGEKTLFKSVQRLMGSHMGKVSLGDEGLCEAVRCTIQKSCAMSFDRVDKGVSRDDCLRQLATHFLEAVNNRANVCSSKGIELIADVSGGFDTRAIVVALEKLGINAEYYTHCLVTGDESSVAQELVNLYDKSMKVVNVNHDIDMQGFSEIVYISDCMVNGWTGGSAWKDSGEKKKLFLEGRRVANFMGLVGETLRHPFHIPPGYSSLAEMVKAGILLASIPDDRACELMNVPLQDIHSEMISCFENYDEKTLEGRLKRFYYEYYSHLGNAGEDRTRRFFWTLQPFWSTCYYMFLMNQVKLSYTNFSMFTDLIRLIDKKGLKIPFYGSTIDPENSKSWTLFDIKASIRYRLRNAILSRPYAKELFRRIKRRRRNTGLLSLLGEEALSVHGRLKKMGNIMSESQLKNFFEQEYHPPNAYRVLSLLMYLEKLEEMYGEKLNIKD